MVRLGELGSDTWESIFENIKTSLDLNSTVLFTAPNWRKLAHQNKLNRELFTQYGYLKDVILDYRFQFLKSFFEENISFEIFLPYPILSFSSGIVILILLSGRVTSEILGYAAALIFNVNPFYLLIGILMFIFFVRSKKLKPVINSKSINETSVLININKTVSKFESFDIILIGGDISSYYLAAILSKFGKKCCLLHPKDLELMTISGAKYPCSVPIFDCTVNKPQSYQLFLDVLSLKQKRILFSPLPATNNGFINALLIEESSAGKKAICSRMGESSLESDFCQNNKLDAGNLKKAFEKIRIEANSLFNFFIQRTFLPHATSNKMENIFTKISLQKFFSEYNCNLEVIDYFSSIASNIGFHESLSIEQIPIVALMNIISMADQGNWYCNGGAENFVDLCLESIHSGGGSVFTDVNINGLMIEQDNMLSKVNGVIVSLNESNITINANEAVVSGLGCLSTYSSLFPLEYLNIQEKEQLSKLTEKLPTIKTVFWISGSSLDLGLTSIDYFEKVDEMLFKVWSPSSKDESWSINHPDNISVVIVEIEVPKTFLSSTIYSLDENDISSIGPTVYLKKNSQNHFLNLDENLKLELKIKSEKILKKVFPKASNNVLQNYSPKTVLGYRISNDINKYEVNLSTRTNLSNFYLTGSDLSTSGFSGELQSAWITANSILGYSLEELIDHKNFLTDLQKSIA